MPNFQTMRTKRATSSVATFARKRIGFNRVTNLLWIFFFFALPTAFAQIQSGNPDALAGRLLILQAYGSSSTAAGASHSFVELYNATNETINLDGIRLFFANGVRGAGVTQDENWRSLALNGSIPPKTSFLILGMRESDGARLQIPINSGDVNNNDLRLSNRSFKVALIRSGNQNYALNVQNPFTMDGAGTTAQGYIDMLGAANNLTGNDPDNIFGYETAPARNSASEAPRRRALVDTDNNAYDFESIRFAAGGITDEQLEFFRPKNRAFGTWNPIVEPDEPTLNPILPGNADALAGKLLILQAYGSAIDANGTTHSFVELYNTTDAPINLNGITLFHADGIRGLAAREAGVDGEWRAIPLRGIIPPQTSFLILGRRQNLNEPNGIGSGNFPRFAIAENSGDINDPNFTLSNRAFKVALIRSTGDLTVQNPFTMDGDGRTAQGYIDMLGSANDINNVSNPDNIFGFEFAPTRNSASQSARRKICADTNIPVDTNNNAEDFENIDFRAWSESNPTRITDEELEIFRPKNLAFGAWNPRTGEEIEIEIPNLAQRITSFRFSNQSLGWGNSGYWHGVINQNARTITFTTQRWIENIDQLPAVFELDNEGVARVNGIQQWSGSTENDFRRDVIYTVGENEYTVIFLSPQATGLPVVRIDLNHGGPVPNRTDWQTMTFLLNDPNNPENDIARISNQQIRGRGNSTWNRPKNPYRIRFRDDQQQGLFGLPPARNWVLLANYFDNSLIKTSIAFELGRRLGLECTPTYHHVELFLNGEYQGSYLLTEHRQADPAGIGTPGRPKVDANGWLVEIAFQFDTSSERGDPGFRTSTWNMPVLIKSPDFPDFPHNGVIPGNVNNFVRNDWNTLTQQMTAGNFPNNNWRNMVDFESFVRYFMVQVITQNADFNVNTYDHREHPGSTFFHRQNPSSPIKAGPLWDFDLSLGAWIHGFPNELRANTLPYPNYSFFNRFFQDPTFLARYHEVWNENFVEHISSMVEFIDDLAAKLERSIAEDSRRWSRNTSVSHTEINRLRRYFTDRIAFLDNFYNGDCGATVCHRVIFGAAGYGGFMSATANGVEIESGARLPAGSNVVFTAIPSNDFYVKEWMRNGMPVSNNVTNTFTISNLSTAETVTVEFSTTAGIGTIYENPLHAWIHNGILHVAGLDLNERLRVFTTTGAMIYYDVVRAEVMNIPLNVRGVYIIQNGNSTLKVVN